MRKLIQQTKPNPNVATRSPKGRPAFPAFETSRDYADYASGKSLIQEIEDKHQEAAEPVEDTPEARIDAIVTCIGQQAIMREALYKLLAHCTEPRNFRGLESFASELDEVRYGHLLQSPYNLVNMLVKCGALTKTPVDAAGSAVTPERLAGLTEDEQDDLVEDYLLEATPEGRVVLDLLSPQRRLKAQLAQKPHRLSTFLAVLDFCREPRSFEDIKQLFKDHDELVLDYVDAHQKLSPDFYVDRLEKAGGLVWRRAWVTTEAGLEVLSRQV